jgi:hypothetical protein
MPSSMDHTQYEGISVHFQHKIYSLNLTFLITKKVKLLAIQFT